MTTIEAAKAVAQLGSRGVKDPTVPQLTDQQWIEAITLVDRNWDTLLQQLPFDISKSIPRRFKFTLAHLLIEGVYQDIPPEITEDLCDADKDYIVEKAIQLSFVYQRPLQPILWAEAIGQQIVRDAFESELVQFEDSIQDTIEHTKHTQVQQALVDLAKLTIQQGIARHRESKPEVKDGRSP